MGAAGAATRDLRFTVLGAERGLSQNTVTAFAQDARGFMWVGTQGGLHRYDGQRYAVLRHDPRDPTSLPDSYITALALDGDTLWVGGMSEYVARLDLRTGAVRRYRSLPGSGRDARALLAVPGGVLVGTSTGLHRLDAETGAQQRWYAPNPVHLRISPAQALVRDGADVLYANGAGLVRLDARHRAQPIGPPGPVTALVRDATGTVWVARDRALHRLAGNALVRAWSEPERVGTVVSIARAPDGALWMAGDGTGLARWDPRTGATTLLRDDRGREPGMPESGTNLLAVDASGLLWAGGRLRGVSVADPAGTRFARLLDVDGRPLEDSVRALHEAADGELWVSTDNGRLLRAGTTQTTEFTGVIDALPQPLRRVTAIAADGPGSLWLATLGGLLRLDIATRRVQAQPIGEALHLRSMLRARDGSLWLGTASSGVVHRGVDGRLRTWPVGSDGDASPPVHALLEDRRGRIWVGTGDGVGLVDPARGTHRHFVHGVDAPDSLRGNLVRALLQSRDGTVWVGTHSGLSRVVEDAGGRIRFVHPLEPALGGRPEPVVFTLVQDAAGALWLGTDAGLVRFDPARRQVRNFGLEDGLQAREFNGNAVARLADGRLAFGGVGGVNVFDPARIRDSRNAPPVRLLGAQAGARAPIVEQVLWNDAAVHLGPDADLLRLRVGALDFAPSERVRYRYRLLGFDPDWIDNGNRSDITYTRVPPGRYTFMAQGTNRDGVWSPAVLRVPLEVAPSWWRHPATRLAMALLIAALAAWLLLRRRRARRREQHYAGELRERDERLKLALWASGEQFWDYDIATGRMRRMDVLDPVHGAGSPDIDVHTRDAPEHAVHPDDLPLVLERLRAHVRGDTPMLLSEHRIRDATVAPDGSWVWVRARGRVVERDAAGRARRIAGTARDITASRHAERERRVSSEVLRSMAEAVAVFDRDFLFVAVNPAFTEMTGYAEDEVLGRPTSLLDGHVHAPVFYETLRAELQTAGRWAGELWQQRKDGAEFLCWLQASAVEDAHGAPGFYVAVLGDITEQKRAEQELRYLANYDALTSLPNRTLLSVRLSDAIDRARRDGTRVAVLFLDLDRFKDINDTLGHAAGDRLLCAAAKRVQQAVGVQHTVARLGGDEFTVVLEKLSSPEEAAAMAERVLAAFGTALDFTEGPDIVVSPSIGIALYPDHAQLPADLLKHADTAMYHAKAAGRRTWARYDVSMDVEIRRRATISAALRKVLERDEFELVFQPQLCLADDHLSGVEALLRWTRGEHGAIEPAQFIPLAEETGLILEIGEWVLREACRTLQHWRTQGFDALTMAVNVSALQLLRGDFPTMLARILEETGVPAHLLELELTESMLMANAGGAASTLQALQRLGVRMAIDDFGTGYSSLAYLRRLPIHTVKIDKAFVDGLGEDGEDRAIAGAIIAMGHSLGLDVVAEGVETAAQLAFLRAHGCDEAQGYWLARPMDADACLHFLQQWRGGRLPA